METKQTAVEWLIQELGEYFPHEIGGIHLMVEKAKQIEKERGIELIKDACMYQVAGFYDKDIASMTYEDVYNTYYNKN